MKKTISINISGVIFHIEEDGYDKLKGYLTSIQHYFSTYEDSQEIITDIENRIAEKLLTKLKTADKLAGPRQVVTLDDVTELIQSMGTVADFEAIEEEDIIGANTAGQSRPQAAYESTTTAGPTPGNGPNGGSAYGGATASSYTAPQPPRKLYRDLRRKLVGGVASGIANYFNIDPVWVRLIFVTLILALPPFSGAMHSGSEDFFGSLSAFTIILYIAMWVAFPGSTALEDDKSVKKFYRNPDDKVLGGVASGISAYFGIDSGLVRLLFVLSIFLFGTGLLAYIILWIISPVAQTLTEKMEMQGEPITLSNIETNIKRSLNLSDTAEESPVAKVLLFPFRLIATIFNGLGRALGPLAQGIVSVIRIFIGVLLIVVGFSLMIGALAALGGTLGMQGLVNFRDGDVTFNMIRDELTLPLVLSGFVTIFIPGLALAILGVTMIAQRKLMTARTSLALLAVWFVGLIGLGATVPPLVNQFNRTGTVEETQVLTLATAVPTFAINDTDGDGAIESNPSIELEGYNGTDWRLEKRLRAQGPTRREAQANARAIIYNWSKKDSLVRFDKFYELKPGSRFRAQDLDVTIYVPYNRPFRMTEEFARYIRNEFGDRELERMKSSLWKFTEADGLVNINYGRELDTNFGDFDTNDAIDETLRNELGDDFNEKGEYTRQFDVTNFSRIDIGGAFAVRVKRGDSFKVVADGREEDVDDLRVQVEGGELHANFRNEGVFQWRNRHRVGLTITMPNVEEAQFSGATQSIITGFENVRRLNVSLSGACKSLIDVKASNLDVSLSGASKATLRGRSERLNVGMSGACKVDATAMRVGRADVNASGASSADFGQVNDMHSRTSGASKVNGPSQESDENSEEHESSMQ